jgi:polyhydroxyalkanoate synthesis regulator phasin
LIVVEGVVQRMDLQDLGGRIEALTEKVESLRRFL